MAGVTGFFFLVPLFFMDFSHAEQEELNAYRDRYNHLAAIAADKGCDIDTRQMPPLPQTSQQPAQGQGGDQWDRHGTNRP